MRLFTLAVALVFAGAASAYPPPPPKAGGAVGPSVTFQAAPLGQLLDDLKVLIRSVAGPFADMAIQEFDKEYEASWNKLDGFDLKKPIGGYVLLKDNPEDTGAVFALPYTDEAKFVASISNKKPKATPVAGNKGLYKYDSDEQPAPFLILIRFHDGYAYVSLNVTEKELDVGSLVTPDKLIDPKETAQFAAKGAVEKIPPALVLLAQKKVFDGLAELKKNSEGGGPNSVAFATAAEAYVRRNWTAVTQEGDGLGLKLRFDTKAATLHQDYVLSGKAGSNLSADIAAWAKPKENRFSGLADKAAAAQVFVKLPIFVPEVRDMAAAGIAALEGTAKDKLPEPAHALVAELIGGLNRTAKSGNADLAAVLHGPDAAGTFTAVLAVSFDDAPKVEAELQKLVKAIGPKNIQDAIQWNVAKSGNVNLHEMKIDDVLPPEAKKVFGDKAVLVVGFDKTAVFVGVGPEARAKVTAAAVAKPTGAGTGPSVLVDTAYNPTRLQKLITAIDDRAGGELERMIGNDDALQPFFRTTVAGGTQLTVTQSINLRIYGGFFFFAFRAGGP